ncbi:hypothetical protein GCM10009789_47350 [Kribbella sancticallisti]|uniref:Uncharacterized protein n=1 Tax=Kribbella sancticallisti TaxID=460087 RepID=A0ABP4PRB9_9ACTN
MKISVDTTVAHSTGTGRTRSQYSEVVPIRISTTINQSAGRLSAWPLDAPIDPNSTTIESTAGRAIRLTRSKVVGAEVLTLAP